MWSAIIWVVWMPLLRYKENSWLVIIHRIRCGYLAKFYCQQVSKAFSRSINTPQESDRNMGRRNLTYEITPNRRKMLIENIRDLWRTFDWFVRVVWVLNRSNIIEVFSHGETIDTRQIPHFFNQHDSHSRPPCKWHVTQKSRNLSVLTIAKQKTIVSIVLFSCS